MKALLITVAGTSSRFSKSLGIDVLKCIYYEKDFQDSLLYNIVNNDNSFDKYVIVGGYKFEELQDFISTNFCNIKDKITLLENKHYADYGSGYSLYIGLKYALEQNLDELVFAEGDLWIDKQSFLRVSTSVIDAVTYNMNIIDSRKSVVFYYDISNKVHYIYSTSHSYITINQPFLSIFNSGQVWKFCNLSKLQNSFCQMRDEEWKDTNLSFIQKYYGSMKLSDYALIKLDKWYNCNTVEDYRKMLENKYENLR